MYSYRMLIVDIILLKLCLDKKLIFSKQNDMEYRKP